VARLTAADVACWVFKSSVPRAQLAPGWRPGTSRTMTRCVRPSYRLGLMAAGQPCLLWLSGRADPGVHAVGSLTAGPQEGDGESARSASGTPSGTGSPVVPVRLTLLAEPLAREALLADPRARDAEVLRMPAGSNPSWLSPVQFAVVLDGIGVVG
jgi:hypothetical protein